MWAGSPWSSQPWGAGPRVFEAAFDIERQISGKSIVETTSFFDRLLIEQLHRFPEDLRTMNRRRFEELIAELFVGFGYLVELTQRTRDGGKDIIAIRHGEVNVRYLIECKRPDPGNPVAVSTVRELYGVKTDDGASKAILATTSYLTPDAKRFVERHQWELEAREFDAIRDWISKYTSGAKQQR